MVIATWILYTVFGILVFSLAFLWAVRARQFWDQDRARYLPLEGEETGDEAGQERGLTAGVALPIIIFVAAMAMVVLMLVLSYLRS